MKAAGYLVVFGTTLSLLAGTFFMLGSSRADLPLALRPEAQPLPAQAKTLRVPYVSQGKTNWCFLTSLDMVLQYYGKSVGLNDMARSLDKSPETSMSLVELLSGQVDAYVSRWPDISLEHVWGIWGFEDYRTEIDSGRPIIVSSFGLPWLGAGHTVVVTGYLVREDGLFLYVHDPSGFLTNAAWHTRATNYALVSWEQFAGFSRLGWSHVLVRGGDP